VQRRGVFEDRGDAALTLGDETTGATRLVARRPNQKYYHGVSSWSDRRKPVGSGLESGKRFSFFSVAMSRNTPRGVIFGSRVDIRFVVRISSHASRRVPQVNFVALASRSRLRLAILSVNG